MPINIFLENAEGQTIFADKQACDVNGRKLEELYGKTVFDFFSQPIAQLNRDFDLQVWKQRQLIPKELLASFKGKEHHMYTGKTIIHIDESGEDFLLGFGLDISDRVKTEEKFRSVIEQAADSIFLISIDGTIIEVNPTACESLHYSKAELSQMRIEEIFTSLSRKITTLVVQDNALANFEDTIVGKNHHQIPVDVNIRLIKIGKKEMYLAICRDISEKKGQKHK